MRTAIGIGGAASGRRNDWDEQVAFVREAERLGVDTVWSAEAWGQDAVVPLAYLAGVTERIRLGSGIMQISARVPSMTAMTALTLATVSGNRFVLGLGVSGPQVVEGLQGVPFAEPLQRLRETVDIVRLAFAGESIDLPGPTPRAAPPGRAGQGPAPGPAGQRRHSHLSGHAGAQGAALHGSDGRRVGGHLVHPRGRRRAARTHPGGGPGSRARPGRHRRPGRRHGGLRRRRPAPTPLPGRAWPSPSAPWAPASRTSTARPSAGPATRTPAPRWPSCGWPESGTRPPHGYPTRWWCAPRWWATTTRSRPASAPTGTPARPRCDCSPTGPTPPSASTRWPAPSTSSATSTGRTG